MQSVIGILLGAALMVVAIPRAAAYPQFQLSRDQTCTNCHVSPSGGGLLTENGYNVADASSQLGTPPEFMYGKVPLPSWLALGGDLRGATGFVRVRPEDDVFTLFPMQADLYVNLSFDAFSLQVTAGARPAQWVRGNGTPALLDRFWVREHYVMWQQKPGTGQGLFARAGRFMPVFGLRFVEHPFYNRQYGGTPLYADTYGAAVEYIMPKWEAHLSGFIEDPLIDPPVRDNGVAAYTEVRLDEQTLVGGGAMVTVNDGNAEFRIGATGKLFLPSQDILLQAELQFAHQQVTGGDGAPNKLVAYVMASRPFGKALLLDVGLSHYDENLAIEGLDRDAIDVNLHWFVTSHFELVLQNRIEGIGIGANIGGPTSGWSLLHGHYRL
jgi:hypothetical protein